MAEQAQHIRRAFDHVAARAVDALHPGIAQEVIVLRRDHAAGDDLDVGAAGCLAGGDQFGDQRLVTGRERAEAPTASTSLVERQRAGFLGRLEQRAGWSRQSPCR